MLILKLAQNSFLVIARASYHDRQTDHLIQRKWKPDMVKVQLYDLIVLAEPKHRCYVINKISTDKGHNLSRRLLLHPDLDTKFNWIARKNTTFKFKNVEQLCCQRFSWFLPHGLLIFAQVYVEFIKSGTWSVISKFILNDRQKFPLNMDLFLQLKHFQCSFSHLYIQSVY
jgi:hypothetical protein